MKFPEINVNTASLAGVEMPRLLDARLELAWAKAEREFCGENISGKSKRNIVLVEKMIIHEDSERVNGEIAKMVTTPYGRDKRHAAAHEDCVRVGN